jgi:cation:H+ antiporter
MTIVFLILGLALLVWGGEWLVRGASRLAAGFGISPLIIGVTIVAFGTSMPEMVVSTKAAWIGQADIALGNVVGSNIFNVLFILGACALVAPLVVAQQLVRVDVPVMIGVSLLTWLLAADNHLGRFDGALLVAGIVVYTVLAIRKSRQESAAVAREYAQEFSAPKDGRSAKRVLTNIGFILAGLVWLVLGARWLVESAVTIARQLGVSELVIGLTIVAAGTSLPEVATSIIATVRGERDIAIGNVIGSNLFNVLGILGVTCLVAPTGVAVAPAVNRFDLPVMVAVAAACLPIFFTGHRIARWEGALFFGYYVAYVAYLVLAAREHDALPAFSAVMLWFVIPLTGVTLAVVTWRSRRGPATS